MQVDFALVLDTPSMWDTEVRVYEDRDATAIHVGTLRTDLAGPWRLFFDGAYVVSPGSITLEGMNREQAEAFTRGYFFDKELDDMLDY